jgi:RNA polymerase sigma-70 factor (ECF subfamily)
VEERELIDALRAGDERAFEQLLDLYGPSLLRLAQTFVRTRAAAEEVVQDTWIAVLRGIDRFEGRSSLKTWIFRILVNTAKTRGARDARSIPFSALAGDEPAVDPERFFGPHDPATPGAWATPPREWPEEQLEAKELRALIDATIADLPPLQRQVITMRDVEGFTAEETCNALELSESNQRVLLHRARNRVRRALERHLDPETA